MPQMIFVNLPVADLPKAKAFYEAIGAVNEPKFTNDQAACMVFSDTIFVMLLTHPFFQGFTSKRIADAHESCQVLLCISRDSREAVDEIAQKAVAAGGRETRPVQDMGMIQPRLRGSGRPRVGADVDGPGGRRAGRIRLRGRVEPSNGRRTMSDKQSLLIGLASFIVTAAALLGEGWATGTLAI